MYGRKHSYRLYCKLLNEAARWSNAVQNVIDSKAPIETPTQQLIQDIKVGHECFSLSSLLTRNTDFRIVKVPKVCLFIFL